MGRPGTVVCWRRIWGSAGVGARIGEVSKVSQISVRYIVNDVSAAIPF